MSIYIRSEQITDVDAITRLTTLAFEHAAHSSHTEQYIVNALRRSQQLTVSLLAEENQEIIGHVAVSPVTLSTGEAAWYGLGPISVCPHRQGQGVGSALMTAALGELRKLGAAGCVVLGEPDYYGRFGFKVYEGLMLPGLPQEYFLAQPFAGEVPCGAVQYHSSFDATQ